MLPHSLAFTQLASEKMLDESQLNRVFAVLFLCSQDNKILLWDVRKATGPLLSLDQHNGSGSSNLASGKSGGRGEEDFASQLVQFLTYLLLVWQW